MKPQIQKLVKTMKSVYTLIALIPAAFVYIWIYGANGPLGNVLNSPVRHDECPFPMVFRTKYSVGHPFDVRPELLRSLGVEPPGCPADADSFTERATELDSVVVVTGSSRNHFTESVDAVASVQANFGHSARILFYDLGLSPPQRDEVTAWCHVELRTFNGSRYPAHVRNLMTYAFKVLIIHEVLREFGAMFWVDASVRFMSSDLSSFAGEHARRCGGLMHLLDANVMNSVYSTTHPRMYRYLPVAKRLLKETTIQQATGMLLVRTRWLHENVLYWLILCALDPGCIAPTDRVICPGQIWNRSRRYRFETWIGCHRYDQSAINVLTAHARGFNTSACATNHSNVVAYRHPTSFFQVHSCL